MNYLSSDLVRTTVKRLGSRIFTVDFEKKNGEIRKLNARRGVRRHLRGGNSTLIKHPHLMTVWDLKNRGYRCFNVNKVIALKGKGKTWR